MSETYDETYREMTSAYRGYTEGQVVGVLLDAANILVTGDRDTDLTELRDIAASLDAFFDIFEVER